MRPVHLVPLLVIALAAAPRSFGKQVHKSVRKAEPSAPAIPQDRINNETDPRKQLLFDQRLARGIEMRIEARLLASLGRQSQNPLPLIAAAQLFQQAPPLRPLRPKDPPPAETSFPPGGDTVASVLDSPEPQDLLAEARALVLSQPDPLRKQLLALLDQIAHAEVLVRGAVAGPQQACNGLVSGGKLSYSIPYQGGEKAVLALSDARPSALFVTVSDDEGNVVASASDRTPIVWYPRWSSVFRIQFENHAPDRVNFCLETN